MLAVIQPLSGPIHHATIAPHNPKYGNIDEALFSQFKELRAKTLAILSILFRSKTSIRWNLGHILVG